MSPGPARRIGVVTGSRSDYGIYLPLLRAIVAEPELALDLYVTGAHLAPEFGRTVAMIEADGFPIGERIEMLLSSDTPEGIAKSMGLGTIGFAQAFARQRPDLVVLLGDRFEMHAAAVATVPFNLPIAHLHGGELTYGAIDEGLRHSITKLAHLHFVATEDYAARLRRMGEEPWRIVVSGAPTLDNLHLLELPSAAELATRYPFRLDPAPILVTFHPVTHEWQDAGRQTATILAVLDRLGLPVLFTLPNADTGGRVVIAEIERFVSEHEAAWLVRSLGIRDYLGVLGKARAMVGNSSSGLIEAPSFELPVVNIGRRQEGRTRARNVIDVPCTAQAIEDAIRRAISEEFRASLTGLANPYGDGQAAPRIVAKLKATPLDERLIAKRFYDGV